jgi:3-oxoacyl-[acyl-carrier protein] reductase
MTQKTALIIGGSRGIGRSISIKLAQSEFDITLTYNTNVSAAEEVKKEIESFGVDCEILGFDVSNYDRVQDVLGANVKKRVPDIVVYNSGIAKDNLLAFMSKEEWDRVLDVNLNGFFNVMKTVLFDMLARKSGRIIIISSTSGEVGQAGQVNYAASKAGLIGAGKSLAKEVGKKNILVNIVSPGVTETDMTTDLPKDRILSLIPLKRFGKPEDVAAVVNFLATEENMYIHGQVIGVNGGLAI